MAVAHTGCEICISGKKGIRPMLIERTLFTRFNMDGYRIATVSRVRTCYRHGTAYSQQTRRVDPIVAIRRFRRRRSTARYRGSLRKPVNLHDASTPGATTRCIVRTYGLPHPAMNTQMDLQSSVLRLWRAPDLRRNDRLWSSECSAVGNPHEPSFSFQRLFTSLVMPP